MKFLRQARPQSPPPSRTLIRDVRMDFVKAPAPHDSQLGIGTANRWRSQCIRAKQIQLAQVPVGKGHS